MYVWEFYALVLQRSQDGIYFYTIKGLFKVYIYQAQRKVKISAFLSEKINGLNVVHCAVVFFGILPALLFDFHLVFSLIFFVMTFVKILYTCDKRLIGR